MCRGYGGKRHPEEMGKVEVERFLTYLAVAEDVVPESGAVSTC